MRCKENTLKEQHLTPTIAQQLPAMTELQQEKEELSRQVKRLVHAEAKLYAYQEELDAQLREYKDLYELNRILADTTSVTDIYRHTVAYVVDHLAFERAIFLTPSEDDGEYRVCALNGYYDEKEKEEIARITLTVDAPLLLPLREGKEYLICLASSENGAACAMRHQLHMDEYLIYPLGSRVHPHALLAVGNTERQALFYRRVTESEETLLSMGQVVGLISAALQNRILYDKMKEALALERLAEEKYRQLNEALEQRVKETVAELRQKDRLLITQGRQAMMGEMISNIAHQWRQPLNRLGLLVQQLQMAVEEQDFNREVVDQNVEKAMNVLQHMSRTIDDFRYFFRPEHQKVPFRVRDTIEKALTLLEGSFETRHIAIEAAGNGDPIIIGYPSEFTQVLLNILINARDAFASNEVPKPAVVIRYSTGSKTTITIADNAGGIPEKIIAKIFDPYFTTKGPEEGTGIGLFMSKMIIEKNMNGRLSARNVGDGAEFTIEV